MSARFTEPCPGAFALRQEGKDRLSELSQTELDNAFVGTIVNGLALSTLQRQMESCTVRLTSQTNRVPEAGRSAYLILASGEWIAVVEIERLPLIRSGQVGRQAHLTYW